jgi:uncharacterized protein YpbB
MTYKDMIILYCLRKINGERTIYSVFHLLKGKKSSQTIQDAHLFGITNLFKSLEFLDREMVEATVKNACENKWISQLSEQRYILTSKGEIELDSYLKKHPLPTYLNGWKNHHISKLFWERISLFVQVISNLTFQESRYVPVQKNKDAHHWMKNFLQQNSMERSELGSELYKELVQCFAQDYRINPNVFVLRLTGYRRIGLTSIQASQKLGMEYTYYHIEFQNILHFLIQTVEEQIEEYELLSALIVGKEQSITLTQSTQKTYDLLKAGYSIYQVSKLRALKQSTIEDHVVEIVLNIKDFSINPYIDIKLQHSIKEIARKYSTKQLRYIREKISHASYFEIRLVLAKYGEC